MTCEGHEPFREPTDDELATLDVPDDLLDDDDMFDNDELTALDRLDALDPELNIGDVDALLDADDEESADADDGEGVS